MGGGRVASDVRATVAEEHPAHLAYDASVTISRAYTANAHDTRRYSHTVEMRAADDRIPSHTIYCDNCDNDRIRRERECAENYNK